MNLKSILYALGIGVKKQPKLSSPTAPKLPFYQVGQPRLNPEPPVMPEPNLEEGWQWVPVPWLYYWMVKMEPSDPVSVRCRLRMNGLNSDTTWPLALDVCRAYCPNFGERYAPVISDFIQRFRLALKEPEYAPLVQSAFQELAVRNETQGVERLQDQSLFSDEWSLEAYLYGNEFASSNEDAIAQAIDVFLEKDRFIAIRKAEWSMKIRDGRHRICAAYKFEVPALPVNVRLNNL